MKGLWQETINPQTGESSLTENIKPKAVGQFCAEKDHHFEDPNNIREAVCITCGLVAKYVVGKHLLKNGKLVPLKRPS